MSMTSTWRQEGKTLPAGLQTVYFKDTQPNNFIINNLSGNYLYMGMNTNINADNYLIKIAPNSAQGYSLQNGVKEIYIYNAGATASSIIMTSYEGLFDANFLTTNMTADMVISLNTVNTNLQLIATDIINKQNTISYVVSKNATGNQNVVVQFDSNFYGYIKSIKNRGSDTLQIEFIINNSGGTSYGILIESGKEFIIDIPCRGFKVSAPVGLSTKNYEIIYSGYTI